MAMDRLRIRQDTFAQKGSGMCGKPLNTQQETIHQTLCWRSEEQTAPTPTNIDI